MSGGLSVDITSSGRVSYLRARGAIDDTIDPTVLQDAGLTPIAVLNLAGVEKVEDAAAKTWRQAIMELGEAVERLVFVECSPAIVERINRDPSFVGAGAVASVKIGMRCEACDRRTTPTVDVDIPVTDETLEFACAECGSDLQPESDDTAYFAFLDQVPIASLGQDIQVVIGMADRSRGPPTLEPGSEAEREAQALADAIAAAQVREAARTDAEGAAHQGKQPAHRAQKDEVRASAADDTELSAQPPATEPEPELPRLHRSQRQRRTVETEERIELPLTEPELRSQDRTDVADRDVADAGTDPSIQRARRSRRWAAYLHELAEDRLAVAASGVIAALVVVVILLLLRGPAGIPPETLLTFHRHLEERDFEAAEQLLAEHADDVPEDLEAIAQDTIDELRDSEVDAILDEARTAFARKDYAAAATRSRAALEVHAASAGALFVTAESMRLLGRLLEAAELYERFAQEHAGDPRIDDVYFWLGQARLMQGELAAARSYFARVIEIEASNYKTSAGRRIAEIDAQLPEAASPEGSQ